MHSHRAGVELSLLRYYARYCGDHQLEAELQSEYDRESQTDMNVGSQHDASIVRRPEADRAQRNAAAGSGDALIDCLNVSGIPYVDNRSKSGALWISKSAQTDSLIKEFRAQGVRFVFSESKQQWWTRDPSPKTIEVFNAAESDVAMRNQHEFARWLKAQNFDAVEIFSLYATARKIHKLLLAERTGLGLFGIQRIDSVRACVAAVRRNASLINGSKMERRLWVKALECYLRFVESRELSNSEAQVKAAPAKSNAAGDTLESACACADGLTPQSVEKSSSYTISIAGFSKWLQTTKPNEQEEFVVKTVNGADQFAQRNHMRGARLVGVMASTVRSAVNHLIASNAFSKSDARLYQDFKRVSPLLVEYAQELSRHCVAVSSQKAETGISAPIAQAASDRLERIPDEAGSALETSLLEVLQGDQLSALRQALSDKGIRTLADLKQLNLWVFMNQNGLYSIGQRQAVYTAVRRALESKTEAKSSAYWKITTRSSEYIGSSPAEALMEFCRAIASKYPLRFRGIIGQQMSGLDLVPLLRARIHEDDPHMDNPVAYVSSDFSADRALACAQWICAMCRDDDMPKSLTSTAPVQVEDVETGTVDNEDSITAETGGGPAATTQAPVREAPVQPPLPAPKAAAQLAKPAQEAPTQALASSELQRKVEQLVLTYDVGGVSLDQLYMQLPSVTMVALKVIRDASLKLVDMGDKLVHVDAFVDWEEAAGKLSEVLGKLMTKNNGYVSSAQLFDYARVELRMFLNDNDIADERSVYCVARHMFEKEGWQGIHYTFTGGNHISRDGSEALHTNLDVISRFARDHNGFFKYDDLADYLGQVGIKTGNLRGQMNIGIKPYFFYYSSEEIISVESMSIDAEWLGQAEKALKLLFEDAGDHIVLRAINQIWYEQLPALPGYLPWTPLLLQYVLLFYGKRLGAKTVCAELSQKYDVLHAMLVAQDSEIQTFADAVVAYLVDNEIPDRQFDAEELRGILLDGGMIAGNELIWNMRKAIGSDPRFIWTISGERVTVRV